MANLLPGPCTVVIQRHGKPDLAIEFSEVDWLEIHHDLEEPEQWSSPIRQIHWKGTKLTISGRLRTL
jgi:hypothetical protein